MNPDKDGLPTRKKKQTGNHCAAVVVNRLTTETRVMYNYGVW